MTTVEFKKLIEDAKLVTLSDWECRFVIGLQINLGHNIDVTSEVIEYLPAEFLALTAERAASQIEACRRRLVQAATEKLRIAQ